LLFANESKSFYLSEIAKIIGSSAGNTQRELERLVKDGIVKSEKKANLRYYGLDRKNPIFSDLENIVKKTIGIEAELKKILDSLMGVKFSFIFGSYLKGEEFKSDSDVDIIIIGTPDENKLSRNIGRLERAIGREINYHIYSSAEEFRKKIKNQSFLKNVVKKYQILTGDKNEFKRILR
jgi:predicted nucleotidyltransferase